MELTKNQLLTVLSNMSQYSSTPSACALASKMCFTEDYKVSFWNALEIFRYCDSVVDITEPQHRAIFEAVLKVGRQDACDYHGLLHGFARSELRVEKQLLLKVLQRIAFD